MDARLIATAMHSLGTGTFDGIVGDKYSGIDWVSEPTFSEEEFNAEVKRLETEWTANSYKRDRQYPSIGDQLDMLFHDMTAGKGSKTGEWYKAIAKVKADNPKK